MLHTVNISLGTPPQTFTAAIDTGNDNAPLVVPGKRCVDNKFSGCKGLEYHERIYNSSESSTYHRHGAAESWGWGGTSYDGILSEDVLYIGDIDFRAHFDEWETMNCRGIGCIESGTRAGFDAILGLSPPWETSNDLKPSTLGSLLDSGVLEKPVFSWNPPSEDDGIGELMLGGALPPRDAGNATSISFAPGYEAGLQGLWPMQFNSFSLDHPTQPVQVELEDHIAIIVSSFPGIMLPREWGTAIKTQLGAQPIGPIWSIPCDQRGSLPVLGFSFGPDGRDSELLNLTGFDYIRELHDLFRPPGDEPFCAINLEDASDYGVGDNVAVLGSAFLKGFYTTFDFYEREIQCELSLLGNIMCFANREMIVSRLHIDESMLRSA